nr:hypothetical protein NNFBJPFD_00386 [Enterobacter cloacae]
MVAPDTGDCISVLRYCALFSDGTALHPISERHKTASPVILFNLNVLYPLSIIGGRSVSIGMIHKMLILLCLDPKDTKGENYLAHKINSASYHCFGWNDPTTEDNLCPHEEACSKIFELRARRRLRRFNIICSNSVSEQMCKTFFNRQQNRKCNFP